MPLNGVASACSQMRPPPRQLRELRGASCFAPIQAFEPGLKGTVPLGSSPWSCQYTRDLPEPDLGYLVERLWVECRWGTAAIRKELSCSYRSDGSPTVGSHEDWVVALGRSGETRFTGHQHRWRHA